MCVVCHSGDYRVSIQWYCQAMSTDNDYNIEETDPQVYHTFHIIVCSTHSHILRIVCIHIKILNAAHLRLSFKTSPGQIELRSGPTPERRRRTTRIRVPRDMSSEQQQLHTVSYSNGTKH